MLSLIDRVEMMGQIFNQLAPQDQIKILFGDELGVPYLEPCGFVLTRYQTPTHSGVLGVIGPNRLNYPTVIPTMRYFSHLLSELEE